MGKGFQGVKAAFIGSHSESDKIPRWLKANGGQYSREVDKSVTHLIATESAIEKEVDAVQTARSLNVRIVTYDWLEDSLLSKGSRPKREGPYLWDRILRERGGKTKVNRKSEIKKMPQKKRRAVDTEKLLGELQQGARAIVSVMEKLGYHLYHDDLTGASYSASLVRHSLINNRSRKETFHARVYETNDAPHTYSTFVKYTRVGISSKDILAPRGSTLESALFAFKKFFYMKTGIDWKYRFHDLAMLGTEAGESEETTVPPEGGWFRFERPGGLMAALNIDAEKAVAVDEGIENQSGLKEKNAEDVKGGCVERC